MSRPGAPTVSHREAGAHWLDVGRPERAVPELQQALAQAPSDARTHSLLAFAYARVGQSQAAVAEAQEGVRLAPARPFSFRILARAWLAAGDLKRADLSAGEAIRLDPNDPEAYVLMAEIQRRRFQYRASLRMSDEALRRAPASPNALNARAVALIGQGRTKEAQATIGDALHEDPAAAYLHHNLGLALFNRGEPVSAAQEFTEALRLNPDSKGTQALLDKATRQPSYIGWTWRSVTWWFGIPFWQRTATVVVAIAASVVFPPAWWFAGGLILSWFTRAWVMSLAARGDTNLHRGLELAAAFALGICLLGTASPVVAAPGLGYDPMVGTLVAFAATAVPPSRGRARPLAWAWLVLALLFTAAELLMPESIAHLSSDAVSWAILLALAMPLLLGRLARE